ncbi:MAG: sulfotransferase domain-containing protein [Pseudomonadales bacterium]
MAEQSTTAAHEQAPLPSRAWPEIRHVYQNHHLDSTRWRYFEHRPGDIVISTSYKAGTTWMQTIVGNLLYPHGDLPAPATQLSPWLEERTVPLELLLNQYAAETGTRFIKTHLALDGLPFREDVRYVVVARDPRDVFMSLLNHWGNHTSEYFARINAVPGRVGEPFPPCGHDVHEVWRDWISRGWFDWESEGYPYWGNMHHSATWWAFRHLPNVTLVHYADLLADLDGQMRALADFLEIEVPARRWPHVVDACTFATVKRHPERVVGEMSASFSGGAQTFINQGTNGRWRGVLSDADLELYEAARLRVLPADCARWLERGWLVAD